VIQVIEGALIAVVCFLLGVAVRSLPARRKSPKPVEAVCGCEHHHSMHDPKTGACNAEASASAYDKRGNWIGNQYKPCACLRYSGPEPLGVVFAPEIATEAGE
jgi:hypothetical protein